MNNISFDFTAAALVSMLGAALAVAVSFGCHLTQDNIHTVLTTVGIVLSLISVGGGIKSAALIKINLKLPGWLMFTPATLVGGCGAVIKIGRAHV